MSRFASCVTRPRRGRPGSRERGRGTLRSSRALCGSVVVALVLAACSGVPWSDDGSEADSEQSTEVPVPDIPLLGVPAADIVEKGIAGLSEADGFRIRMTGEGAGQSFLFDAALDERGSCRARLHLGGARAEVLRLPDGRAWSRGDEALLLSRESRGRRRGKNPLAGGWFPMSREDRPGGLGDCRPDRVVRLYFEPMRDGVYRRVGVSRLRGHEVIDMVVSENNQVVGELAVTSRPPHRLLRLVLLDGSMKLDVSDFDEPVRVRPPRTGERRPAQASAQPPAQPRPQPAATFSASGSGAGSSVSRKP